MEPIAERIAAAEDVSELRAVHDVAVRVLTHPEAMSEVHDQLFSRVVGLVVARMEGEGWGRPPSSYCWIQLGSGARREQMISTDQDNALIYGDEDAAEADLEAYFSEMARRVVFDLAAVGYPLCKGYVMAINPRWRGTPAQWRRRLEGYLAYPDWSNIRLLLIAVDQRPVCGDANLGLSLRRRIVSLLQEARYVLWTAARHGAGQEVALTPFGRIRTGTEGEWAGAVDLKTGLYMQLVGSVRLWALENRLEEPATIRRIEALTACGAWDPAAGREAEEALSTCIRLRWNRHRECVMAGRSPDDRVHIASLPREEREALRRALTVARALQKRTYQHFQRLYWRR